MKRDVQKSIKITAQDDARLKRLVSLLHPFNPNRAVGVTISAALAALEYVTAQNNGQLPEGVRKLAAGEESEGES